MSKRRLLLIATIMLCLLLALASPALAEEGSRVLFRAGQPDDDRCFRVSMLVQQAEFNALQFALRYDTTVLQPVGWEDGQATGDFGAFAKVAEQTEWLVLLGANLDVEQGLIDFTGYVSPGSQGQEPVNEQGLAVADATGLVLVEFRFRLLKDAPCELALAVAEEGKPSNPAVPEGGGLAAAGVAVPATVLFEMPEAFAPTVKSSPSGGSRSGAALEQPAAGEDSVALSLVERRRNTIIMQVGNYAALTDGLLCHAQPGEKAVAPYLTENGVAMLPLKFVAQQLQATVGWEAASRTATLHYAGQAIRLPIGAAQCTVDGRTLALAQAVALPAHGRTMIPADFVTTVLARGFYQDQANQLLIITEQAAPWQAQREAEQALQKDALLLLSPLVRDFVGE